MESRRKLTLSPTTKTSLKTRMTVYASGIAAVMALAVVAVFITPGDMEGRLPGYKWRKTITIDSARVAPGAMLTDFVLLVEMEDPALRLVKFGGEVVISSGADIRFTAGDGALALPQQIEEYDGKTGRLRAWVQLDTLRQDRPPVLFLYFGNPHPDWALYPDSDTEVALEIPREQPSSDKARWLTIQNNRSDPRSFIQAGEAQHVEAPRPVQIDHFQAGLKGGSLVLLEWATNLENRNKTFVIERSADGKHYQAIGKTSGANTSAELLRYTYADHSPPQSQAFYRLIQIGKDNTYSYSAITRLAYDLQQLAAPALAGVLLWFLPLGALFAANGIAQSLSGCV